MRLPRFVFFAASLVALTAEFSGCVTRPSARSASSISLDRNYTYTEKQHFASVVVGEDFSGEEALKEADVNIYLIDGKTAGTLFHLPGVKHQTLRADKAGGVWVSRGSHALSLTYFWRIPASGDSGSRTDVAGAGSIEANFVADHAYALTAILSGKNEFAVTLWDETNGMAARTSIGHWEFAGWTGRP